jgi:two-component system sensor histidine kinase HydH
MRILQFKRLYLPAISILAVVILLLILISISTLRNLDRQEQTILQFVHQQGMAIIQTVEAGARAGMMSAMGQEDPIESLLRETAKNDDIAYIYLIDSQGAAVHHSNPPLTGMSSEWRPVLNDKNQIQGLIRELPDGTQVYDMAKNFSPPQLRIMAQDHERVTDPSLYMTPHQHSDATIVLGLKMTTFETARQSDFQHAVIMATIVVVLGSGVLFFIFIIQNYYLVDRTLKLTRDYTRHVVANMANGLLSIDPRGRILSYNLPALELLDLNESEVKEMDLKSIIDFKATGINDTLTQCQPVLEREFFYGDKSGTLRPMTLSVTPILNEDKACTGAVIVLRDLREIKRLEAKVRHSEKLAAIGKLAAGVAHEIRNPLSSIRGFARFLSLSLKDRSQDREYAEIMVKEVDRINAVVNDLLTFSRPLDPELTATDVRNLVEHSIRLVEADSQARDVVIHMNISPSLNHFHLDANQITQALLNLILNALQEVESGGKIEVGAKTEESGTLLNLWVEDDGPGISPDILEKIFDPFFTTRKKGTGLGLAIVHKIVENHGGDIQFDSPLPGKARGCRFVIAIPATPAGKIQHDHPKTT